MSLIVIGTDTDVGKTIASAVLLTRYAKKFPLSYWKPVATGSSEGRDSLTIRKLCGPEIKIIPETYLFELPVSPHLAAEKNNCKIDPQLIIKQLSKLHRREPNRGLLIEGIGGLLVPLTNNGYLLADLIKDLDLHCLLVSSTRVGTINHTLLTLEALQIRDLSLAGILLNGPPSPENHKAIEKFGQAQILGTIEPLELSSIESFRQAASYIDPKGLLEQHFRTKEK